jgi:hypothetical protein
MPMLNPTLSVESMPERIRTLPVAANILER